VFRQLKSLGPGLLYAGAAIGVSHLVQSTKAGASYGYILIIAIVLAHVFKYPFFVLGPRYAQHTGQSLVSGYAKMGQWAVILLLILSASTMFTVQAAVTMVTAGLLQNMGIPLSTSVLALAVLLVCFAIIRMGNFTVLDHIMKVIMVTLALSTIIAFVLSFSVERNVLLSAQRQFVLTTKEDLSFLLAFVGWMPAPLDLAIWHSIWTLSSSKKPKGDFDFNVGFYGTAILGICFLVLGANTMYGNGIPLEASAGGFAAQLINAFTTCLGPWSYWFITIAAFTTMFSTTLTCFDALPRVMNHIGEELKFSSRLKSLVLWQIILALGTVIILFYLVANMGQLVNFATTVSFLTAPILAMLSYRLVTKYYKGEHLWNRTETILAIVGIAVLLVISILYLLY
jgi:Mn2+/Fe2+ NRAMP family transporter